MKQMALNGIEWFALCKNDVADNDKFKRHIKHKRT